MPDCFYWVASKFDADAADIERRACGCGCESDLCPQHLRQLAADIRRDTRPCARYPGCGCDSRARPAERPDGPPPAYAEILLPRGSERVSARSSRGVLSKNSR